MSENQNQTVPKKTLLIRFPFIPIPDHIKKFERFYYDLYFLLLQEAPNNTISLEVVNIKETINFYLTTYETLLAPITNIIFSIFPDTEVETTDKFNNLELLSNHALGYNLTLLQQEAFSIRTYLQANSQDPLVPFLNLAGTLEQNHAILMQIIITPRLDEQMEAEGRRGLFYSSKESGESVEKPKFDATMRMLYFFPDGEEKAAEDKVKEVVRSFHEFSSEKNKIIFTRAENSQKLLANFFARKNEERTILNTEEITTLFHIPDPTLKIEAIDWVLSKRAQPPFNLPTDHNTPAHDISLFATTNFRASNRLFGIKRLDRRRHLYVVGKSGTGKSKLLLSLITDDIVDKQGVCVIDPHGDLVHDIIQYVPAD
ncbi:MAG: hypothetical protein WCT37_05500, partial [Patescibacteria group bacterium]